MAFVGAPINDLTGNISSNKGGGAMTMALGEDGTGALPPQPGAPLSDQAQYNFNAFGFNPTFTNPDGSTVFTGKDGISTIAPDLATANQQYLDTITQQLTSDVADLQGTNGVNPYIGQNLDSIQSMGNMYQSVTGNPFAGLSDAITTFQGGNVPAYNEPAFNLSPEQQQQNAAELQQIEQTFQEQQDQQNFGVGVPAPTNFGGNTMVTPAPTTSLKGGGAGTPVAATPTIMTQAFGEEGNPPAAPGMPVAATQAMFEDGTTPLPGIGAANTRAIGEDNSMMQPNIQIDLGPPQTSVTRALGEDGQGIYDTIFNPDGPTVTTMAVGEEGDIPSLPGNDILLPPGGDFATTQALGEEEGDMMPPGGTLHTTQAMFEDGMIFPPPAPPVANPFQPQPFNPRPPVGGGKGGGMQPQPQPFQPYQPQPFMPQPPMYGGGFGMPYGGSFGSPYGNPYGGGFGGGYGMQRPQPFGGNFFGNPYMPPPPPTPYGGGKGGGFGQQQIPQPQPQPQPGGKGGGQLPVGQNSTGGNFGNANQQNAQQQALVSGGLGNPQQIQAQPSSSFLGGMLGAGSLLGGQQNTGGSSNNASPFGGSSGGGSRTAMF
jgi:hypothetical protein